MKKFILLILFISVLKNNAIDNELNCEEFKKYSSEYFNCKTEIIKNKALSFGKEFVEDTKEYQKKNLKDGKEQIEKTKEQLEQKKEEILKK